jgi:hypothetical protein
MSWSKITFFIFQVNLIFLLFSCPEPISENYLARLKDTVGPEIIIYELENGSVYLNTINIKGKVVDNTSTASQPGAVTTLTYEVSGGLNIENTKVTLDQTGAFEFTIIAGTKTKGSISIKLTATDWNGNTKTTVLTLYDDAITGISILSRNKGAELIWEELPLTNDYTIYFEIGTTPTIESKNKIAVPRTSLTNIDTTSNKVSYTLYLPDIKNGCQLHILLQANMLKGAPNLFPPQTTIPLSPLTLTPTIKEGYNQLELEWPAIEATVGYEIYRSTVRDASYSCIATTAPNVTSYEDENVNAGDLYFYKVCPAGYHEEVLSRMAANSGKTFFLPPLVHNMNLLTPDPRIIKNYTNSDILRANDSINDIIIKDDFVYVLEYETGVHEFEISNPGNPTYKRSWPAGGKDVHSLYLSDEFPSLIFALGYKELYMIDISKDVNANGAVLLAGFESEGMTLNDIVIKNKLAYVAAAQQGLQILDLTDPANPESQPPFDVDSTGNTGDNTLCSLGIDQMDHLFVGDIPVRGEPSIFGFDINALHPALKNRLSVVDGPINLVAKGNKIYYCY